MRGDFSVWNKDRSNNFRGTLHQQGRVLLDRDWNAQTEITGEWQETAARDTFGAGVAAVPADESSSFQITQAEILAGPPPSVQVSVTKGHVWADGLLIELDTDVVRTATYLGPPIQSPPGSIADLPNDKHDAVILETWLEELSAFQNLQLLFEPALGGVDTTERQQAAYRFRLYRMSDGETCDSIIEKLKDDFSAKGKLTADLQPDAAIDGDCPVVEGGGYTGFEHRLYRIEIADTDRPDPEAYFKWSQVNGGLVGTGDFDTNNHKVTIVGNRNAILNSGLKDFYLEVLELDADFGYWTVIYGAKATLAPDNTLTLPQNPPPDSPDIFKGVIPKAPATGKRFFRLWNGIERIKDFTVTKDLPDHVGIRLKFDAEAAGKFTPSDYWTFEVRAGSFGNTSPLIADLPPQGIHYHRVPLAEVDWTGNVVTGVDIEDCRQVFPPLTKLRGCCTFRVGDGIHSHGDFRTIQAAIDALPKTGGEICVLPGIYEENIILKSPHNRNITLHGCGVRSRVTFKTDDPVIHVQSGQNIRIESLAITAHTNGIGILLEGNEMSFKDEAADRFGYLQNIVLSDLFITSATKWAVKGYGSQNLTLANSKIYVTDKETDVENACPAVYLEGDDLLIERNEIRVLPAGTPPQYRTSKDLNVLGPAKNATGGLQIGGGSDRVRIINNLIVGGMGNGITLGSVDLIDGGEVIITRNPWRGGKDRPVDKCNPDPGFVDDGETTVDGQTPVAGPPLFDVLIKFNRIFNMGRNGIGVATFFSMGDVLDLTDLAAFRMATERGFTSIVELVIAENRIEACMNIDPQTIPENMTNLMGYGGISLADTEYLTICDNFIVGNGPDFFQPICGIFVLQAESVEISRNQILNNGLGTDTGKSVANGPRGGIWISSAVHPIRDPGSYSNSFRVAMTAGTNINRESSLGLGAGLGTIGSASGIPAAKIHENIVSVPLGRALTLIANGAVSVTDNQFTSFGIQKVSLDGLFAAIAGSKGKLSSSALLQLAALLAGNILIINLGRAADIIAAAAGFASVSKGQVAERVNYRDTVNAKRGVYEMGASANLNQGSADSSPVQQKFFDNGSVLFANNQCVLDLTGDESGFTVSSILMISLDDIGFHGNQSYCELEKDFILTNTLVFGMTSRTSDNRFRETGQTILFSAITLGALNITTDNESTRCLLVRGSLFLAKYNLVLAELAFGAKGDITDPKNNEKRLCNSLDKLLGGFGMMAGAQASSSATTGPVDSMEVDPG